jgi:hypothetical protein
MLFLDPVNRKEIPDEVVEIVGVLATTGFSNMGSGLESINQGRTTKLLEGVGLNAGKLTYNGAVVGIVRGSAPEKPSWI